MPNNPANAHGRIERSLKDIDWSAIDAGRSYFPSPACWEDEVLYFLFVDRFSDGSEYGGFADGAGVPVDGPGEGPRAQRTTPQFQLEADACSADRQTWFEAGKSWCGGTLAGLQDKLGYLQRLGISAVWLSPVLKQVTGSQDYHGYGVQNFLDVDPHFGTRDELRNFVTAAHAAGIRVILDIILNHAGDVFAYNNNRRYFYHQGRQWPVEGFRSRSGDAGSLPFEPVDEGAWPDGAVWPAEFQTPETWTRRGEISDWDAFPNYLDGDFLSLKDIDHGRSLRDPGLDWDLERRIREFGVAPALLHLAEAYKFWIAHADIDGYRIDTVKHMEPGAVRVFANIIHEYAQTLGKENFYLIGEVTGGRQHAVNIVNTTGIDAALGINEIPHKLESLAKGQGSPGNPRTAAQEGYFDLFKNSLLDKKHSHQWYGKHVVTLFDDHDQVGVKHKFRFCGRDDGYRYLRPALGLNLTSAGIPCLYYGTEQGFNGADHRRGDDDAYSDVFLRECMFGGPFGSLQSTGRHFFTEAHEIYRFVQAVSALRQQHIALRRGRQYLREVSASGEAGDFHYPQPLGGVLRWVVAWSRIFADREYLCAINTDADQTLHVWVTVDHALHPAGSHMRCLFSTDPAQQGITVAVSARNGSALQISVPPAGFVVYR